MSRSDESKHDFARDLLNLLIQANARFDALERERQLLRVESHHQRVLADAT